ncbi:hypothetical protein [Peribacillus sp. NJ4]|uniref:hypothetical protein n=1 Tax=Peribacillus sp. NJ4 TaxID=3055862 RepID=UPI0025A0CF3D|nr:hypothetical protein [Peribacillus sp. NJ4]
MNNLIGNFVRVVMVCFITDLLVREDALEPYILFVLVEIEYTWGVTEGTRMGITLF